MVFKPNYRQECPARTRAKDHQKQDKPRRREPA
jgi:hypothetical protein